MYSSFTTGKAVDHGRAYESVALSRLEAELGVTIERRGLILHPQIKFLGASPDGFTQGRVVEVKCPFYDLDATKKKNANLPQDQQITLPQNILDAVKRKLGALHTHLTVYNGQLRLKPVSSWYAQIQTQMECADVDQGYLYVFLKIDGTTVEDSVLITIGRDREWWEEKAWPKVMDFYHGTFLPEVVNQNGAQNISDYKRNWQLSSVERRLYTDDFLRNNSIEPIHWGTEPNNED